MKTTTSNLSDDLEYGIKQSSVAINKLRMSYGVKSFSQQQFKSDYQKLGGRYAFETLKHMKDIHVIVPSGMGSVRRIDYKFGKPELPIYENILRRLFEETRKKIRPESGKLKKRLENLINENLNEEQHFETNENVIQKDNEVIIGKQVINSEPETRNPEPETIIVKSVEVQKQKQEIRFFELRVFGLPLFKVTKSNNQ